MNLLRSGVDPAVIAMWLGHANLRSVERYIPLSALLVDDMRYSPDRM
jgi:site-specific recombinase XerD